MERAWMRAYGDLGDFLPPERRGVTFPVEFELPRGARDLIQSVGIPHPEVDVVLVDGEPVGFDARVGDGDRVAVYPRFAKLEVGDVSPVHRPLPRPIRFACDAHLLRLARYLRMLGFDVFAEPDIDDARLVEAARHRRRVLLTRDLGILMRRAVTHGAYIRSVEPEDQMVEVVRRFDLSARIRPFTRCLVCNAEVEAVDPDEVEGVPADLDDTTLVTRCRGCQRVFWEGSHVRRMRRLVTRARWAAAG